MNNGVPPSEALGVHERQMTHGIDWDRWPWRVGAVVAIVLPPLAILYLILTRGVNVPYSDEWTLVPFVLKAHAGTVTFGDLWAQHNEHRIASVRLLTWLLLPFSRFNLVSHMLVAFGLAAAALVFFWRALCLTFANRSPGLVFGLTLLASLLFFSVVQWETWIYALPALQWQLGALSAAVTLWALARWPGRARVLVIVGIATLVSMTAVGSGVVLGAAALGGFVLQRYARRQSIWPPLLIGSSGLVLMTVAYFSGYQRPGPHPDPWQALRVPGSVWKFTSVYLGLPLAYGCDLNTFLAAGSLALLASTAAGLLVLAAPPEVRLRGIPWLTLWVYTVVVAALTAVGRVGMGLRLALSSRYAAAASLFWVALVVLGVLVWREHRERLSPALTTMATGLGVVVVLLASAGYVRAWESARRDANLFSRTLALARDEIMLPESVPDGVRTFLCRFNPAAVAPYAALMQHERLGPYANTPSGAVVPGNARVFFGYHDVADCTHIAGWAMDASAPERSISIDVSIDARLVATVKADLFRQGIRDSGFGTGRYGFVVPTPELVKDGRPHVVRVRAAGTSWDLADTSRLLRCGEIAR